MKPPSLLDWVYLFALVAIWGTAFLFNKIALTTLSPSQIVFARLFIGALVLLGLLAWKRLRFPWTRKHWIHFCAMALFGNALPFFLIAWGQQTVDSGIAGILMAVMPLMVLFMAHFTVKGEEVGFFKLIGFLLGFTGILLLTGPQMLLEYQGSSQELIPQLAILGGATCYALAAVIAKKGPDCDVSVTTTGVLIVGSIMMVPTTFLETTSLAIDWSPQIVGSLFFLSVIATAVASLIYFHLVRSAGPSFLSLINYLIPIWAALAGALVMKESIPLNAIVALAVILMGVFLSQWKRKPA